MTIEECIRNLGIAIWVKKLEKQPELDVKNDGCLPNMAFGKYIQA
jgi:uncharacterized protein YuzB (UPF0349 family)